MPRAYRGSRAARSIPRRLGTRLASMHDRAMAQLPFSLDARLAADTIPLGASSESQLLLMNEQRYPWLILVPRRAGVREIYELPRAEQVALLEQSCVLARVLSETFRADKINLAALGNVVPQLHVHHVARFVGDPAWPGPVWGHSPRQPCGDAELAARLDKLMAALRPLFPFEP
jgi:diadenosine tetraphosphate (Ap4A) HIT family hydrolase